MDEDTQIKVYKNRYAILTVTIVVGILLVVLGSMSVHEALSRPEDDTTQNNGLLGICAVTLFSCIVILFWLPARKKPLSLIATYAILLAILFGVSLSVLGSVCAVDVPNAPGRAKALEGLGGATIFVGLVSVILSIIALYADYKTGPL